MRVGQGLPRAHGDKSAGAEGSPGCQGEERGRVRSATQHHSCSMNNGSTKPFHQTHTTVRPHAQ